MANNRLYLINTSSKECIGVAKSFGSGWQLRSVNLICGFLSDTYEEGKTNLILVSENSPEWDYWQPIVERINDPEPPPNYYEPPPTDAQVKALPDLIEACHAVKWMFELLGDEIPKDEVTRKAYESVILALTKSNHNVR